MDSNQKHATVTTKQEFEKDYPLSQYEVYSLESINKFREELKKGKNSEALFKEATKDLKHFLVYGNGKSEILFIRKKLNE